MNILSTFRKVLSITALAGVSSVALAGQDCILEGEVKEAVTSEGKRSVYIDFHSAKRYSADSQCRFRKSNIKFDGIVGSQIANVSPGTVVTYRYTAKRRSEPTWQLLQLSI